MMSRLSRGAHIVGRITVPAACFGTGYACSWSQGREETVPQLVVCAAATSWAGFTQGLRLLRQSLPLGAQWPRDRLAEVEAVELHVLLGISAESAARGLDSAPLRRVVLRRLCQHAEAHPRGPAVAALGAGPGRASRVDAAEGPPAAVAGLPVATLAELATQLDTATAALAKVAAPRGEVEVLLPLTAALQAIVTAGGNSWHEELGPVGVLHVARAALLASAWLAAALRPAADLAAFSQPSQAHLSEEDKWAVVHGLSSVWQALGQPGAAAQVRSARGSRRGSEAAELHRDAEARLAALTAPGASAAAVQLARRPAEDFLPAKLRARIAAAMAGAPKVPAPPEPAAAVVEQQERAAAAVPAGHSGPLRKVGQVLEYSAWAVIIGAVIVALSEDGIGCLRFHAVPSPWRDSFRSLMQQQAVQVEELLAKYDPPAEPGSMSDSIMLGPWGAQSTYIQAPRAAAAPPTTLELEH